ncbi:SDR family NAD(P)-dependent oxidoreductase [Streptomyces sp. ACA25]|uniref:type I polyketide synthase n=1 Tax=Streptomyces sp. ACA25 TaxID=3022596 RepID=UPI0023078478|nr:type I polyketide synthase [Streptomyces sp. ACA25]MDB1087492.1 SDR family NAD(P)-dependent oxidoreductase [Streptomyces sp. ACA25]
MTGHVAVVGLACRFPGAPDADAFWDLLTEEREALTRFTDAELAARGVPVALRRNPAYVPVGGLLTDQESFDPAPFGIGEVEAELMDPQQRVFLETAWHALEHAGHGGVRAAGTVGVYAGAALSGYLATHLAHRFDPLGGADPVGSLQLHTGNVADYLPLRTAHRLGLTGPAVAVGATCATSLVAVHTAVQALLAGECDTALAGGVSLRVPQGLGYLHVPDGPFSADGSTRPYAQDARGTVFTQGAGAVVLRRLEDALADGDTVHAVVRGSAVANDGADRAGFTAPSPQGQARTIAEALAVADLGPRDIGYIEGHGTGTLLGDPIEVQALRRVFGLAQEPWCLLGSVKGNIGHADSAAGIAGFIKAVLTLRHGTVPASLHAGTPNPELGLDGSAFRIARRTEDWHSPGPRRAGVSSFGIGGTNCHVVLEQAPVTAPVAQDDRAQLLVVSAATAAACRATAGRLADAMPSAPGSGLADAAYTLATGRAGLPARAAVAVAPGEDAAAALRRAAPAVVPGTPPRVVLAFPGGGAQYAGMAADLYREEPAFAEVVDELAGLFRPLIGAEVRDVLLADPGDAGAQRLARTPGVGLPALFTASVATAELLAAHGLVPDAVLGHSVGEYAAAVAAGVLSRADAARLVAERSVGMAHLPPGGMLAVPLGERDVRTLLAGHPDLDVAAVNATDACAVSGPAEAIGRLREALTARGVTAEPVAVEVAAHSRLVEAAMPGLRSVSAGLRPAAPRVPLVTTLTGKVATAEEITDPEHWVRHLRGTVLFADALETALDGGPAVLVQAGPGGMLAALAARKGSTTVPAAVTVFPRADEGGDGRAAFLAAVGRLWAAGVPVDPAAGHRPERRRLPLPGYAFQRSRFWVEPAPRAGGPSVGPAPAEPDATQPLQLPVWRRLPPLPGRTGTAGAPEAATGRWLVLGDGPYAAPLRAALHERGAVALDTPPAGDGWADLTAVVYCASARDGSPAQDSAAVRDEILRHGRLAAALPADLAERSLPLLYVTAGGEQVTGAEHVDPVATAARGLPRVLGQEAPAVRWRSLDLPPGPADPALVGRILAEAADLSATGEQSGTASWELALRGAHRWLRQWEPWQPDGSPALPERPVVVVTGGLGNVGLALAGRLCRAHGARMVLIGRTGLPAAGAADAEPRLLHRAETVRRLREEGHDVRVEVADATDSAELMGILDATARSHGRVDLVVHAPVVVELAALAESDAQVTDTVLTPKTAAALALHEAVSALPASARPGTVLLMASAAATIGGFGLGAYVAASRYLGGLAHTLDRPDGTRWMAVDWDRWRFGTDEERAVAAEITMRNALDASDALDALLRTAGLARDPATPCHLAVSPAELNTRSLALAARSVRTAEVGGDAPATGAERLVAAVYAEVLGRPVNSRDADFFALGGHSLLATRVLARLRDEHGVLLRLRDLLSRPTVGALAELLPEDTGTGTAAGERSSPAGAPLRPATEEGAPFPLTRVQHAYRVGRSTALDLGGVGCHFYLEHHCSDLDLPRYQQAWNAVIARHGMLRAVITPEGTNLVLPEVPAYRIPFTDLSARTPAEAQEQLAALRDRLSRRVAVPDRWPLIEVHAVRLPEGWRVLLSVDVLVCDSASYLLVDRELRALYEDPEAELPPVGCTFADCVDALAERRDGPAYERAAAYWRGRADTLPGPPALPVREQRDAPRFGRRRHVLDAGRWQALRERAAGLGATPTAVLLTVYADVLAAWSADRHFALTLTVFDRPPVHPDVDRVVGEFSSLLLHEVDRRADVPFAERVQAAQRQLFEDLDHREFSGLEMLAEQASRTGVQRNVPVVFTGMLGLDRFGGDGGPHDHEWLGPVVHGVSQTPQVWLDHQAYEHRGDLVLQWDVAENVLDPQEADAAFAASTAWLEDLAARPELWEAPGAGPRLTAGAEGGTEPAASPAAAPGTDGQPDDTVPETLRAVWAELLDLEPAAIPADATFLSLGGDSLLAVRMAALVRQRLDVVLALPEVRSDLTLSHLTGLVRGRGTGAPGPRALPLRVGRRSAPEEPFALLPLQQAYFVGQQGGWELSYDSVHYYTDVGLHGVDADTAPAALTDALRRLVSAQPMLRARVLPDGRQRILPAHDPAAQELPLDLTDLRDRTEPEAEAELARVRERISATGPDPVHGPGFAVRLTLLPGGRGRLHIAFSLMVADGWSAQLFARRLLSYAADPNAVLAPLTIDFGDYVAAMEEARETEAWQADRDWWWERLDALPAAPPLPLLADPGAVTAAGMTGREARLPAERWEALRAECAAHGLTPSAVLAAVYAVAVARLSQTPRFVLNTLQSNRHPLHPDVDRMIGAFSSTALVPVDLTGDAGFAELAGRVQEQITGSLSHSLVTGVEVARELARRSGSRRPVAPVVFQSTLGLGAALGGDLDPVAGPLGTVDEADHHQRIRTPQVVLELRLYEVQGELLLALASVDELFRPGDLDRLFDEVVRTTGRLADGSGWQERAGLPSAVPAAPAPQLTAAAGGPAGHQPGAPRDGLERSVAGCWAEILGVPAEEIDRAADFFSLGGDSLLAVRMLTRWAKEQGGSLAPREFLADPSVAGFAAALVAADARAEPEPEPEPEPGERAAREEPSPSAGPLPREEVPPSEIAIPLRDGSGPPLFLLHPSGGDVLCYVELARRLSAPHPLIALADPGLSGYPGQEDIAGMVRQYAAVVRHHQPHGPYLLGGWSMGGTVAHELARFLREEGEQVALLVMIDSNSPDRITALEGLDRQRTTREVRLRYLRSLEAYLDLDLGAHGADGDPDMLERALRDQRLLGPGEALSERTEVFARHLRGLAAHRAGPLDGTVPVLLLRAALTSPRNGRIGMGVDDAFDDEALGWRPHVHGHLDIHPVAGHHYAMLRDPAVADIAAHLDRALAACAPAAAPRTDHRTEAENDMNAHQPAASPTPGDPR